MRFALILSALACGLLACAPEGDDAGDTSSPLPSYELAYAGGPDMAAPTKVAMIELNVDQFIAAQATDQARIIDVRRHDEVADGMIPGAEHIPMDSFDPAAVIAGDDRQIILYCRSGRRSELVAEKLAAHTGKPAIHLAGGIEAWREAGQDIVVPD